MTRAEFDALHGGDMVEMQCENHTEMRWACKKLAITFDKDGVGRYNGQRSLFFQYNASGEECYCVIEKIRLVLD